MSLREEIFDARKNAMKTRNTAALSTLRVLCSQITNEEIEKGSELTDEDVLGVVKRQVKQLVDAKKDFEKAGRDDLVEQNNAEIELLSGYLPEQLTPEAVAAIVDQVYATMDGDVQFGQLMGAVMTQVKGQADGSVVREAVQKKLA